MVICFWSKKKSFSFVKCQGTISVWYKFINKSFKTKEYKMSVSVKNLVRVCSNEMLYHLKQILYIFVWIGTNQNKKRSKYYFSFIAICSVFDPIIWLFVLTIDISSFSFVDNLLDISDFFCQFVLPAGQKRWGIHITQPSYKKK